MQHWLFCLMISNLTFAKTPVRPAAQKKAVQAVVTAAKNSLAPYNCTSLYALLQQNPALKYQKVHDQSWFEYPDFPFQIYPNHPQTKGWLAETFVLTIPQGKICSNYGYVFYKDKLIQELIPQNYTWSLHAGDLKRIDLKNKTPKRIKGRVAVLARVGQNCYAHWLGEIIGRLELLRLAGVQYDYLYVAHDKKYIKDMLVLMGIDSKKIIQPEGDTHYIQADQLIVPSFTARRVDGPGVSNFKEQGSTGIYIPKWNVDFIRNTFLPKAQFLIQKNNFCSKVFISRKDSKIRACLNEDEIFDTLFKPYGFKRYELAKLSFLEQVALFNQAKIIVGPHGAGFTNIVFCQPGARIIELFQERYSATFWFLSSLLDLDHHCIRSNNKKITSHRALKIPPEEVKNYIQHHLQGKL